MSRRYSYWPLPAPCARPRPFRYTLFLLRNLLGKLVLHGVVFFHIGVQKLCIGDQLIEQLFGFGALGLQLLLRRGKLGLFLFDRHLLGGKRFLCGKHVAGQRADLLHHALVALGDLFDHGNAVEHLGKAVGTEDDRPVGNITLLLHGTQALLIVLQQIVLLRLKAVQLRLLFRDQQIVLPELLVEVLHLLIDQRDLMVDLCPLVNDVDRFSSLASICACNSFFCASISSARFSSASSSS